MTDFFFGFVSFSTFFHSLVCCSGAPGGFGSVELCACYVCGLCVFDVLCLRDVAVVRQVDSAACRLAALAVRRAHLAANSASRIAF